MNQFNQVLLGGFLLLGGLYLGQNFLIPVFISALIAMLLLPPCRMMERWGWKRPVAITISLLLFVALLIIIGYLLIMQMISIAEDFPLYREKISELSHGARKAIHQKTGITLAQITDYFQLNTAQVIDSLHIYLQRTLTITTHVIAQFFLILIFVGFFLAYRERIETFILKIAPKEEKIRAKRILKSSTGISILYLTGILNVMLILAVCNYIALNLISIDHALFFAILAALLNIIPFIGSLTGSALPVLIALLTKDTIWPAVGVAAYFTIIQYAESYIFTPFIVGGKVRVNPMAEILAFVLGGVIWGFVGFILFIPLIGIVKVLFDHIEYLRPYGYVIGRDDEAAKGGQRIKKIKRWIKRIF